MQHVGSSSLIRDQSQSPVLGAWSLNLTRAPAFFFFQVYEFSEEKSFPHITRQIQSRLQDTEGKLTTADTQEVEELAKSSLLHAVGITKVAIL